MEGQERIRRRVPARRRRWVAAAVALLAAAPALWGLAVVRQALGRLEGARAPGGPRDAVSFQRAKLHPLRKDGVRLLQATQSARAVARFKDSYFGATDGGLVEFSGAGRVLRRYSVLDGLGESDLTCLAAYGGRLYIGTRGGGLVAFDGEHFERYWWPGRDARYVTALLADQGKLLVGTFAGGLLEFDGEGFREVGAAGERERPDAATVLVRHGPRLYAGTFGRGLWVTEGGRWTHFTSADGLKSDRVVGVVEVGGTALVASDFGLAAAPAEGLVTGSEAGAGRRWHDVATVPSLSGVASLSGQVVLCKDDGETALLPASGGLPARGRPGEMAWAAPAAQHSDARLFVLDGHLWLLGGGGIWRADVASLTGGAAGASGAGGAATRLSFSPFGGPEPPQSPSSNMISALTFDEGGNLWAGSFRDGLDVFAPSGVKIARFRSEELREVNALVPDGRGGVIAATSRGMARFDSALHAEPLGTTDGLAGNPVLHVATFGGGREAGAPPPGADAPAGGQMVIATPRGLALAGPWGVRTLTTVQGLPSNSVNSVWAGGSRAYAGTLGGLAEVSSGRVVRVYKDSNSALTHNWVTAVCDAGGRLFVGTYGGGVFELTPSGELRGFASEAGKAFVNPNAMWGDAERLYVGTLDGALVFDLRSQKWSRLREELPSPAVLSVAGRDRVVYFGTTGGLARFDTSFFDPAD